MTFAPGHWLPNGLRAAGDAPEPEEGKIIIAAWHCTDCDVLGRTPEGEQMVCWSCGGPVAVTARINTPASRWTKTA